MHAARGIMFGGIIVDSTRLRVKPEALPGWLLLAEHDADVLSSRAVRIRYDRCRQVIAVVDRHLRDIVLALLGAIQVAGKGDKSTINVYPDSKVRNTGIRIDIQIAQRTVADDRNTIQNGWLSKPL